MEFVRANDVMPFFIHCDDVEYGLRCGKAPIIIESVHVWHETFDKRQTPVMLYYDTRNPLFVNERHLSQADPRHTLARWKDTVTRLHAQGEFASEYYVIRAMLDFLKGWRWLERVDAERYHKRLLAARGSRWKDAIAWRVAERWFRKKYEI